MEIQFHFQPVQYLHLPWLGQFVRKKVYQSKWSITGERFLSFAKKSRSYSCFLPRIASSLFYSHQPSVVLIISCANHSSVYLSTFGIGIFTKKGWEALEFPSQLTVPSLFLACRHNLTFTILPGWQTWSNMTIMLPHGVNVLFYTHYDIDHSHFKTCLSRLSWKIPWSYHGRQGRYHDHVMGTMVIIITYFGR